MVRTEQDLWDLFVYKNTALRKPEFTMKTESLRKLVGIVWRESRKAAALEAGAADVPNFLKGLFDK